MTFHRDKVRKVTIGPPVPMPAALDIDVSTESKDFYRERCHARLVAGRAATIRIVWPPDIQKAMLYQVFIDDAWSDAYDAHPGLRVSALWERNETPHQPEAILATVNSECPGAVRRFRVRAFLPGTDLHVDSEEIEVDMRCGPVRVWRQLTALLVVVIGLLLLLRIRWCGRLRVE